MMGTAVATRSMGLRRTSQIADHTLVQGRSPLPDPSSRPGLHEESWTVARLLTDSDQAGPEPMTLLEISSRLQLPRAVTALVLVELLAHHLVTISPLSTGPQFIRGVAKHLSSGGSKRPHWMPGLVSLKIVVTGPTGAGASTLVGAAAETAPLHVGQQRPDHRGLRDESLELGCIPLDRDARLHLLAAPQPSAFDALWLDVVRGASGVVVMAHPDRVKETLPCLEAVRETGLPHLVVVNDLGQSEPDLEQIRALLQLDEVHLADAGSRPSTRAALARLLHINQEAR